MTHWRTAAMVLVGIAIPVTLSLMSWRKNAVVSANLVRVPPSEDLGQIDIKALEEISGIAASRSAPGVLYVHNDGDRALIFAVTFRGEMVRRFKFSQRVRDAEDIAIGPLPLDSRPHLFLGDIGDNDQQRESIAILFCLEPLWDATPQKTKKDQKIEMQRIELTYPDGAHDAETLFIDPIDEQIVLVTKEENEARVYATSLAEALTIRSTELRKIATLNVRQVSGGDISPDGRWIGLRSEKVGWLWQRQPHESLFDAFNTVLQRIEVRRDSQSDNGEALAFLADGSGYITVGEGERETLARFPLPLSSAPPLR